MKTYEDNGYRYWYDFRIRSWTIHKVDSDGFQDGNASYFAIKKHMLISFPILKFIPYDR